MPNQNPELFTLKSGRKVAVHTVAHGDSGRTVVFCHAAPGAGNFDPNPDETHARGIELLALDRPAYGKSKPAKRGEWATVSSAADDIAEVLKARKIKQVSVAGWSAGGRVALALAARHPRLVDRVVVIATPAPDEFVPWIPPEQKQGIEAMRRASPTAVHKAFAAQMQPMVEDNSSPAGLLDLLGVTPADTEALNYPGATDRLADMMTAALEVINFDQDVRSIFINIFGGITRGEEVAKGIVEALRRVDLRAPIVIRLDGTNAEEGRQILAGAGIAADKLISKPTMLEAARTAVAIANGSN